MEISRIVRTFGNRVPPHPAFETACAQRERRPAHRETQRRSPYPTAGVASTWSVPPIGCRKPCKNPVVSPPQARMREGRRGEAHSSNTKGECAPHGAAKIEIGGRITRAGRDEFDPVLLTVCFIDSNSDSV